MSGIAMFRAHPLSKDVMSTSHLQQFQEASRAAEVFDKKVMARAPPIRKLQNPERVK